ncbi:hypothetical protein O3P69_020090 [Scylla paramamosain]|uniref:Uncharacterized protein n=1 Tax=Scylla paramamosain TaxID=85552 RepID=A0AAW0TKL5_SCYPA
MSGCECRVNRQTATASHYGQPEQPLPDSTPPPHPSLGHGDANGLPLEEHMSSQNSNGSPHISILEALTVDSGGTDSGGTDSLEAPSGMRDIAGA